MLAVDPDLVGQLQRLEVSARTRDAFVLAIGADHAVLRSYRNRLLARPSFARAVDEARPYRPLFPLFPLGAPERD